MPPEALQPRNEENSCQPFLSDVWALGGLLYEMTTGVVCPFRVKEMVESGVEALAGFDYYCQFQDVHDLVPVLRLCLMVDPSKRGTIGDLAKLFPVPAARTVAS